MRVELCKHSLTTKVIITDRKTVMELVIYSYRHMEAGTEYPIKEDEAAGSHHGVDVGTEDHSNNNCF